jgi:hypothetical protein
MADHERGVWDGEHTDGSTRGRTAGADPGAYVGHEPERETETIPGGLEKRDERVAAVATRSGADPAAVTDGLTPPPDGHREAEAADDDRVREAGDRR